GAGGWGGGGAGAGWGGAAGRGAAGWCAASCIRATTWCSSAPDRSRNGPMRFPASWRERGDARAAQRGRGAHMTFPDITASLKSALPALRGRLLANQSLAELTWFRVGGPAQVLFMPEDESDLA